MCPGAIFTFLHELVKEESHILAPAGVGESMVLMNDFLRRKQPGHKSWVPRQQAHRLPTGCRGPQGAQGTAVQRLSQTLTAHQEESSQAQVMTDLPTRLCPPFLLIGAGPDAEATCL